MEVGVTGTAWVGCTGSVKRAAGVCDLRTAAVAHKAGCKADCGLRKISKQFVSQCSFNSVGRPTSCTPAFCLLLLGLSHTLADSVPLQIWRCRVALRIEQSKRSALRNLKGTFSMHRSTLSAHEEDDLVSSDVVLAEGVFILEQLSSIDQPLLLWHDALRNSPHTSRCHSAFTVIAEKVLNYGQWPSSACV